MRHIRTYRADWTDMERIVAWVKRSDSRHISLALAYLIKDRFELRKELDEYMRTIDNVKRGRARTCRTQTTN